MPIVIVNGKEKSTNADTIGDLITELGFSPEQVVVDFNGELLEVDDVDKRLDDGDKIDVLPMIAGG